jgi:NADH:ubiquinone reductase (H+-translocating)
MKLKSRIHANRTLALHSTRRVERQFSGQAPRTQILILGGGFAGLTVTMEVEKKLAKDPSVEITLINRENFFLFTPMLHEVAASNLDLTTIVNPVRKMLRRVHFFAGEVFQIDLEQRRVVVSHGFDHHHHTLEFDFLVLGLGSVTNHHGLPGLQERALTMKALGDAMRLRNRLIAHMEEADSECRKVKEPLLTFVVAGGGFVGVETVSGINDFVRGALRSYPNHRGNAANRPCSFRPGHPTGIGRKIRRIRA